MLLHQAHILPINIGANFTIPFTNELSEFIILFLKLNIIYVIVLNILTSL